LTETNPTASVLITDAQERSVVAAIRALDAAGYRVDATTDKRLSPGQFSRSCNEHHRAPSPNADGEAYVARLEEIVRGGAYAALLAGNDASLLAISRHRARLETFVELGLPSHEVVRRALSKVELTSAAESVGFRTSRSRVCENGEQAQDAARELGFPVIAKSASGLVVTNGHIARPDTRLIADPAAMRAWLRRQPGPILIQRRERGNVYSCAGVMTADGLLGFAFARYIRTWPPRAGNASFAETVSPQESLRETVAALVDRIGWRGIFELEVIGSEKDGFVAIDFNPRVYGSLALSRRAGASLPALWCDALLGRPVVAAVARPGVCYRWEEGETRNVVAFVRRGAWQEALEVMRPRHDCAHAEFSIHDPGPLAARALLMIKGAVRKGVHRRGSERIAVACTPTGATRESISTTCTTISTHRAE
jgi:predicted ATP-grasp superfamily ATP-dependent carboligase